MDLNHWYGEKQPFESNIKHECFKGVKHGKCCLYSQIGGVLLQLGVKMKQSIKNNSWAVKRIAHVLKFAKLSLHGVINYSSNMMHVSCSELVFIMLEINGVVEYMYSIVDCMFVVQ